eukprot:Em0003g1262a
MADSSEEGDAKNGNLVEEAYEYLTMEIRLFGVKKEQRRILKACHVDPMSGHMGVKRTLSRISERFPNVTSASMRIGNAFILPQNCTRFQ